MILPSQVAFAESCGCNPRTVRKWIARGAPNEYDALKWLDWLQAQGQRCSGAALRLQRWIKSQTGGVVASQVEADVNGTLGADEGPAGRNKQGDLDGESYLRARCQAEEARARKATLEVAALERRLIDVTEVIDMVDGLATAVVVALGDGLWTRLVPSLDSCQPGLRRQLRAAHDRAVREVREEIVTASVDRLQGLIGQGGGK